MKKIQLIAVNAKYMHTNLAVRSLRQAVLPFDLDISELTINDSLWHSVKKILNKPSDIYCFSCYIWNMERVSQLAEMIKKSQPECQIFYGGPEVSYDASEILEKEIFVDGVFCGEGEDSFKEFVHAVQNNRPIHGISGLVLRNHLSQLQVTRKMDSLPFPYTEKELKELKNRILYYESMRGCPFQCAYCLSSTLPCGVRALSLERVFQELDVFIQADVRQVKFVDRTFNILKPRAKAILQFLAEKDCQTNFHFEISADLMDDEMITIISRAPKGRFQFEIGIQSTFEPTLSAISRKSDLIHLQKRVKDLLACGNCHVHVDLIAGLPYEDYNTFSHSYDETMALKPDMLQLGFLKLLKGTKIRQEAASHHYVYQSFPPYEVIANDYINADELRKLKDIDHLTDLFYNSGCFKKTLAFIFESGLFDGPFAFFESFSKWWSAKGLDTGAQARDALYGILRQFLSFMKNHVVMDCLVFDALDSGCKYLPEGLDSDRLIRGEQAFEIVKNECLITSHFPELESKAPKHRIKNLRIACFSPEFCSYFHFDGNIAIFDTKKVIFTFS